MWELYLASAPATTRFPIATLLCIDPGPTTGWAFFLRGKLSAYGQTPGLAVNIRNLIEQYTPLLVICEEYKIYPWLANQHSLSNVPTLQLIGAIKYLCEERGVPYKMQLAGTAKGFCTDDKLRLWGLYQRAQQRHANDAIRHGCHHLLFGSGEAREFELKKRPKRNASRLGRARGGIVQVSHPDRTTPPGVSGPEPGSRTRSVDVTDPGRW
jgi:hypothetical protein